VRLYLALDLALYRQIRDAADGEPLPEFLRKFLRKKLKGKETENAR
jgi:hypothetical protein